MFNPTLHENDVFFAHDAEDNLLSCIFVDNEVVDKIADKVKPECFHDMSNQIIFAAMCRIRNNNKGIIDAITLKDELKASNKLDAVGGVKKILVLQEFALTAVNAERYAEIIVEKYQRRQMRTLGTTVQNIAGGSGDIAEVEKAVNEFLSKESSGKNCKDSTDSFYEAQDKLWAKAEGERTALGQCSGYSGFDDKIGGFSGGRLYILAARPAIGKTALAVNFINKICETNGVVLMSSLEMPQDEISSKIILMRMQHSMKQLMVDETKRHEITDAASSFPHGNLYYTEGYCLTISKLRSCIRKVIREKGVINLVVVDYLQLVKPVKETGTREQEVSKISRQLKEIAMEFNVPVLALSQLSRGVEGRPDKRPLLSDLRDSGAIEQDADVVMLLYRDDYYNEDSEMPNVLEVIVAKHRYGQTGRIYLFFDKDRQCIKSLEKKQANNSID